MRLFPLSLPGCLILLLWMLSSGGWSWWAGEPRLPETSLQGARAETTEGSTTTPAGAPILSFARCLPDRSFPTEDGGTSEQWAEVAACEIDDTRPMEAAGVARTASGLAMSRRFPPCEGLGDMVFDQIGATAEKRAGP